MTRTSVVVVTAFGRGETLASGLRKSGDQVITLDFTEAFGPEYSRDIGPFPVALNAFHPAQEPWLGDMRELKSGLTFWLHDGPIELSGDMATHFAATVPAVKTLLSDRAAEDFDDDWLRRFVDRFASPYYSESWENPRPARFPFARPLGLPPGHRESVMLTTGESVRCTRLEDVQFAGGRLLELAVSAGRTTAHRADQWVWCLSSAETEKLNADLCPKILPRGILRAQWEWVSLELKCEHGPWLDGIPEYVVVIDDVALPWEGANVICLRRRPGDNFQAWVRIPAGRAAIAPERERLARAIENLMNRRLNLARWVVFADQWAICPHAPVFGADARDFNAAPPWRNWDWIAPETLPRLDWSARLEREAQCLARLEHWRRDQIKRRGAASDHALHPS